MLLGVGRFQGRILMQFAVAVVLLICAFTARSASESLALPPITVLSIQEIIPRGSLKQATAATSNPDGGFLIAGGYRTNQYNRTGLRQFYLKISSTGAVISEQTSDSEWETAPPATAFLLIHGGYGVLGSRFDQDAFAEIKSAQRAGKGTEWNKIFESRLYDSLIPLAATGALLPEIHVSQPGESRHIGCGAATRNGFIFAGVAFSPHETSWRGSIPLIEMRDMTGKLLWEHQYPTDKGKALDISPQLGQSECGSLLVASDDSVTIALNVRILPVTQNGDEWVKVVSSPATNRQGVLVIHLDSRGNEIYRAVDENMSGGLLLTADRQTLLIERTVPQFPAPGTMSITEQVIAIKKISATGYRAHLKYFDASSNRAANLRDFDTGNLQVLQAAYKTPEGDILMAGCPQLGGNNYVVHVNPSGAVSPVVELTPGGAQQCSKVVFGSGVHPHEAVVFMPSDLFGARLVTLKY
jgi:hypothetical protein